MGSTHKKRQEPQEGAQDMKLQLWFEIVDTEEQARAIVAREKAEHPRRKKHTPHYTV